MALLTSADVAALAGVATSAQPDTMLVLYRPDGIGNYTTIPAQAVQVVYPDRQERAATTPAAEGNRSQVTFWRKAPFNVQAGDEFELDGHKGGTIERGPGTDPVLGIVFVDGTFDVGAA